MPLHLRFGARVRTDDRLRFRVICPRSEETEANFDAKRAAAHHVVSQVRAGDSSKLLAGGPVSEIDADCQIDARRTPPICPPPRSRPNRSLALCRLAGRPELALTFVARNSRKCSTPASFYRPEFRTAAGCASVRPELQPASIERRPLRPRPGRCPSACATGRGDARAL